MSILVVKTCDGEVYFRGDRTASRIRASEMAAQQVLVNDLSRWNETDRVSVKAKLDNQDYKGLFEVLLEIGCIVKAEVRE